MQPVLPTGCLIRTSCHATTANASSLPSCPSTTAAPVAKECVTIAPQNVDRSHLAAGTTPCVCATAATRNLENFNAGAFLTRENRSHSVAVFHCRSIPLLHCWFCHVSVERKALRLCRIVIQTWDFWVPVAFVEQPEHWVTWLSVKPAFPLPIIHSHNTLILIDTNPKFSVK